MNNNTEKKLVWIDLEMTGLNPAHDVILEIATVITDNQLNIVAQGPRLIIYQPEDLLLRMNSDIRDMHSTSGLLESVHNSTVSLEQACQETLEFIKKYCPKNAGLLAGNSVWQDRNFLYTYMPLITEYLHYRLIDVSTIKELVRQWYPDSMYAEFKKLNTHRADSDIHESIAELAHLRTHFFV